METSTSFPTVSANGTSSTPEHSSVILTALYVAAVCLLMILGTLGNILVLLAVGSSNRLRNWANSLVVNLSIADLLVSVVSMPTLLIRSFYEDLMLNSPKLCAFTFQLNLTVVIVSVTTLGVSSINRYILITKPRYVYRQYCGRNNIVALLFLIWVMSIVVAFVPTSVLPEIIAYVPANRFCHFREGSPLAWWYGALILLVYIFGVMAVIVVSSVLTFHRVTAARNRVQMVVERSQTSQDLAPSSRGALTKQEILFTRMMMIVCLAFCLCMLPYCINHALSYHGYKQSGFMKMSVLLSLSNSCINPLIYAGTNRFFRAAFKKILTCQF